MSAETIKVAVLAALQGVTEILPVSSSGHLVLGKTLLKLDSPGSVLEAVLHGGTLLAIVAYYRVRLMELIVDFFQGFGTARRDVLALILGCIPAGVAGVLFADKIDAAFNSPHLVGYCLMGTGVILLLPKILAPINRSGHLTIKQALVVGFAQILSLLPGVSRSGTTITAGRLAGAEGRESAQFSFLMAIPLLTGALGLTLLKVHKSAVSPSVGAGNMVLGFAIAAVVGYFTMIALNRMLASNRLWLFGPYCLVAGLVTVIVAR